MSANFSFSGERAIDSPSLRVDIQPLMRLVYLWMGLGLLVTTIIAIVAANIAPLRDLLTQNPLIVLIAFIAQFGLVIGLSAGIRRMSSNMAAILFVVYAAVNGLTFSLLLMAYPIGSIVGAFASASVLFGVMTVVGYTTKADLTQYRTYFTMGLIGLIIAMVVNIFLGSGPLDIAISMFGVVLFTALTAYDTQKIKNLASDMEIQSDGNLLIKMAILGALILYLDFINLFLFLLRLFGGGRD